MSVVDPTTPNFPPGRFTSYHQTMDTSQPWCQGMAPAPQLLALEIQAGPHNGDPSRFTQWRSKPVHTMEIQSRFTQWRSKAGSHNGDSDSKWQHFRTWWGWEWQFCRHNGLLGNWVACLRRHGRSQLRGIAGKKVNNVRSCG